MKVFMLQINSTGMYFAPLGKDGKVRLVKTRKAAIKWPEHRREQVEYAARKFSGVVKGGVVVVEETIS
jgi:hypothetical protein